MFNCNWGFMGGHGAGWMPGGMGGFGFFINLMIIGLLVYLGYKLVSGLIGRTDGRRDRKDSLEMLKRRYANGEITTEEFQKMREVLNS